MPDYQFKAMDAGGKVVFGSSTASDQEALSEILRGQGLFLMESTVIHGGAVGGVTHAAPEEPKKKGFAFPKFKKRIKLQEVAFFTSQLSVMLQAGLPILESLELLSSQMKSAEFSALLKGIAEDVSHGKPLSSAFKGHPGVFDEVFISLMAAGEANGRLDVMLSRISEYLEFRLALQRKIRSALLYPMIIVFVTIAVVSFLVVFVLPTFVEVFKQLNIELPLATRMLMAASELIRSYWYVGVGAVAALYGAHRWALAKRPAYSFAWDRVSLSVPIVGELVRNVALTRSLRTMASLLDSGVSILRTLDLAKDAAGNLVFRRLFERVAVEVRDGKPLSASLAASPHIPRVVLSMVATGERTGSLPTIVEKVANYYQVETDNSIANLFAAMEPIFIIILGVMVGGIAVTVLLPMFDVARGIQ